MTDVVTRKLSDVHLKDGVLIESSTGIGMVAGIAANHIIASNSMNQVAAMDSDDFPPVSMVYNARPKLPSRIYCSEKLNMAIFTSEIPLPPRTHRPVVRELIKWGLDSGCKIFVSLDGLSAEDDARPLATKPRMWAVGTTDNARRMISDAKLDVLDTGMISGVSAIMLNEGRMGNHDVIGLFAESMVDVPDAAAAAAVVEGLNSLFKPFNFSIRPLLAEAVQIQAQMEKVRKQAEPAIKEPYGLYS
ncbi:MAG: PAC2 family protein [Thermoplasmata archaeon]|nr:proteasome assembly chaperone family protein [Candidatus Sysuiplasma jiujiangense]MBX8641401.1 PAC2 family protein [Candidatus Sysuiplasma jiujiangense]